MASNLRVDTILPSTGTNVAIGTANGSVTFLGDTDITTSGSVSIGGTLTYEDVTNVDSVGIITARSGIKVTSGEIEIKGSGEGGPKIFRDSGNGPDIVLSGSRGTIASPTASAGTDLLGNINFAGYDGSAFHRRASINGIIDGTVVDGSNTVPTAIKFETGTTSKTERLRIDSSGRVGVNQSSFATSDTMFSVSETSGHCEIGIISNNDSAAVINMGDTDAYNQGRMLEYDNSNNSLTFRTVGTDRLSIDSVGRVTKPYQVAWAMHGSGAQNITGGTRLNFNVNGSGFGSFSNRNHGGVDTTNNSFTAPVTGLYSITVSVFCYTDNNSRYF